MLDDIKELFLFFLSDNGVMIIFFNFFFLLEMQAQVFRLEML